MTLNEVEQRRDGWPSEAYCKQIILRFAQLPMHVLLEDGPDENMLLTQHELLIQRIRKMLMRRLNLPVEEQRQPAKVEVPLHAYASDPDADMAGAFRMLASYSYYVTNHSHWENGRLLPARLLSPVENISNLRGRVLWPKGTDEQLLTFYSFAHLPYGAYLRAIEALLENNQVTQQQDICLNLAEHLLASYPMHYVLCFSPMDTYFTSEFLAELAQTGDTAHKQGSIAAIIRKKVFEQIAALHDHIDMRATH